MNFAKQSVPFYALDFQMVFLHDGVQYQKTVYPGEKGRISDYGAGSAVGFHRLPNEQAESVQVWNLAECFPLEK